MENLYSVIVEMEGGERRAIPIRAGSTGEAFQDAKSAPGVRRVGRVTQVNEAQFAALLRGEQPVLEPAPSAGAGSPKRPGGGGGGGSGASGRAEPRAGGGTGAEAERPAEAPRTPLVFGASGPRVVVEARRIGGEQPFKYLQPPPERPKPPEPPKRPEPAKKPAEAKKAAAPAPGAATGPAGAPASGVEWRILKSRRKDGPAYLLQRGHWQETGGKRTFVIDSEQGFETRELAEQQRAAGAGPTA